MIMEVLTFFAALFLVILSGFPPSSTLRIRQGSDTEGQQNENYSNDADGNNLNPNFVGDRTTIVHLFEWRWVDIAQECEEYLGPNGFAGVQVSPPNENAIIMNDHIKRPWYERYQPVSYKLETRSGNDGEFQNMVSRCNKVGVRIYVDAVINHMTADLGQKNKNLGTGGSPFDGGKQTYPSVPFNSSDFNNHENCHTSNGEIQDYGSIEQVRNCKLVGLNDLKLSSPQVRGKIIEFLNRLISYGVAGFRIDASKHMWPGDIHEIVKGLNYLPENASFPVKSKPFIFQEVIDVGSSEPIKAREYFENGRVTEFLYGKFLGEAFRLNKIRDFINFGEQWGMMGSDFALNFVDNHDNQRGHGAGGQTIMTFRDGKLYKAANAFMLSWPHGVTRVMSSYTWETNFVDGKDQNDWIGPPHHSNFSTLPVIIYQNNTCGNGWVCEHRWREITNMIKFRNFVQGANIDEWWDNGNNQIAYSRGNKGFIAINNEKNENMNIALKTTMSEGKYCDIISGDLENGECTGKLLSVDENGQVTVDIRNDDENMVIAFTLESKLQE